MTRSMLRFVCVLILFVSVVDLAGKSRKKKSVSANVTDVDIDLDAINDIPMELRSLEHWNSLPRETLKLICTDLHINIRGDRVTLARRLHEHFHVHPSLNVQNPTNQVTVPTNQALPNISNDIAALVRLEVQRQVAINHGVASNIVGSSNNVISSALPTANSDRQEGVNNRICSLILLRFNQMLWLLLIMLILIYQTNTLYLILIYQHIKVYQCF